MNNPKSILIVLCLFFVLLVPMCAALAADGDGTMPALIFSGDYEKGMRIWIGSLRIDDNDPYDFRDPIAWIVNENAEGVTDVYSENVLFRARIHDRATIEDGLQDLTYPDTELYKVTLPKFKNLFFSDGESGASGAFRLPGNVGIAPGRLWYIIEREFKPCWPNDVYIDGNYERHPENWCAYIVSGAGEEFVRAGFTTGIHNDWNVRPAFDLNTENIIFAAPDNSSRDFIRQNGVFTAIPTVPESDLKLTVVDSSRDSFRAGTQARTVVPEGTVTVDFSGAETGSNEYAAVILFDTEGHGLYYAQIASGTAAGTVPLALGADLPEGEYLLKVFSFRRNGEHRSDYASPAVEIPLRIATHVKVTFHANNGADPEELSEQMVPVSAAAPLDRNHFTNEGYVFAGWNTEPDGSGQSFSDGAMVSLDDHLDLYAIWTEPTEQGITMYLFDVMNDMRELPRTGMTGNFVSTQPDDVNYKDLKLDLLLPSIDAESQIVSVDALDGAYPVEWLGMKAGLLSGSDQPGTGHSVIAAHNTLNASEYGPFALLSELEEGDLFFVQGRNNELMTFRVYESAKIGASDFAALRQSVLRYDTTVTLLTCEDELPEGGYASRRIVSGVRVK